MNGKIKRTSKINKVKVIELLINRNDYVLKVNVIRLILNTTLIHAHIYLYILMKISL